MGSSSSSFFSSTDSDVDATLNNQAMMADRFAQAQVENVMGRLQQLHGDDDEDSLALHFSQPRSSRRTSALPGGQSLDSYLANRGGLSGGIGSAFGGSSIDNDLALIPATYDLGRGGVSGLTKRYTGPAGTAASSGNNGLPTADGAAEVGKYTEKSPYHVWTSGSVSLGQLDPAGAVETRFTTSGITFGVDTKIADGFKMGVAAGFGWDHSRIGTLGSESDAANASIELYSSLRVAPHSFLDLVVGYGHGTINGLRYSANGNILLGSARGTDQIFATLEGAFESHIGTLQFDPYLRLDGVWISLSPYTEIGSPFWALSYQRVTEANLSAVIGARLRYPLTADDRWLLVGHTEFRDRLSGNYSQFLGYADILGANGSPYVIRGYGLGQYTLVGGLGLHARFRLVSVKLDYDASTASGSQITNTFRLGVEVKF